VPKHPVRKSLREVSMLVAFEMPPLEQLIVWRLTRSCNTKNICLLTIWCYALARSAVLMSLQKPEQDLPHLQKAIVLNAENEVSWYSLPQAQPSEVTKQGIKPSVEP